jgi:AcrR family transcriptional regulator
VGTGNATVIPVHILKSVAGPRFFYESTLIKKDLNKRLINSNKCLTLHRIMSYTDKQLQIMKVAEDLFSTNGYDGTSVRQIADTAGVNLAMISYYFGSKEKLIEAIVESKTELVRMKIDQLLHDTTKTSLEKMYELIDDYVTRLICNGSMTRLMLNDHVLQQNPSIQQSLINLKKKNAKAIQELIRQGQENKEFVEDIDVVLMMATLVGTITHCLSSKTFYLQFHNVKIAKKEADGFLTKVLSNHLKGLFKLLLTHEK